MTRNTSALAIVSERSNIPIPKDVSAGPGPRVPARPAEVAFPRPLGHAASREAPQTAAAAIEKAREFLFSIQNPDGHWCGELEGDTILESEFVLTLHFLGRLGEDRCRKAGEYLRRQQLSDGGWAIYKGGPTEVSASVKAYFVLKLLGDDPAAPHMTRAREAILSRGGIDACNSFTKIYLAIFGQYDWARCPAVPPEITLLPDWFPFNVYRMSSWSRAIVVPLSIIWAKKPSCEVPKWAAIPELLCAEPPVRRPKATARDRRWTAFFDGLDRLLKVVEALKLTPFREPALDVSEAWILERLEKSDGLGAIFPPIINTIIAFRCLGYALDDPRLTRQVNELLKLEIEDEETVRVQPCFSPVWDTAIALHALTESGLPEDDPRLLSAARWVLGKEVKSEGDWKKRNPEGLPAGFYFEYANEFYPDTDDTAEVLIAFAKLRFPDPAEEAAKQAAVRRALDWELTMQNQDGGWGAFDKACDNEILTLVPFADHNAMIDPSCEDITGRMLEALFRHGLSGDHPAVRRAVSYLKGKQLEDGTWYGRWGCNYIYGTWLVATGLKCAGEPLSDEPSRRAADWLLSHQNPDGGWGELALSYDEPETKGQGPSTPSQTAWALMALQALGALGKSREAHRRGVAYLLETQNPNGSWTDGHFTATGFPRVFYLKYHLYATYFPLMALSTCALSEAPTASRPS